MEFLDQSVSWMYFYGETVGGWNLIVLLSFLIVPAVLHFLLSVLYKRIAPIRVSDGRDPGDRGIWRRAGLVVPHADGRGDTSVSGKERGNGTAALFGYVALASARNLLVVTALVSAVLGIAGLKGNVKLRGNTIPDVWNTLPFEASTGTRFLILVIREGGSDETAELILSSAGSERAVSRRIAFSKNFRGGTSAQAVFRMTENSQPRFMVKSREPGLYRIVLVKGPSPVLGYLVFMALAFAPAVLLGGMRRRAAPIDPSRIPATLWYAGNVLLIIVFLFCFTCAFGAFWYLGIKALDHFFRFGIWTTYDHFIQDILFRIF